MAQYTPLDLGTAAPRRAPRRALKIGATALAGIIVLGAATGWFLVSHYSAKIERQDVFGALTARPASTGDAQNVLVLGNDTRKGLTKEQRRELSTGTDECNCTDTMMLVHLAEDSDGAVVTSYPRDLMVTVPVWTGEDGTSHEESTRQLNSVYALGGAPLVVKTIESMTDLRIDHYVQVRFSGVVDVVDALGGVNVCVKESFDDAKTRLALEAGEHDLDGIDSLKYLRLRYTGDGSDLSRIQRQQEFLVNALGSATSAGVLANPFRLKGVLDAATDSFVLDTGFSTAELVSFAGRLNAMDRSQLVLLTVPNEPYPPDTNRVQLQEPAAQELFTALRTNEPVTAKKAKKSSSSTRATSGAPKTNVCAA